MISARYKITDRRVSVAGGLDGTDVTEFSYQAQILYYNRL